MPLTLFDKIYWLRAGLGAIGGVSAELFTGCRVLIPPPTKGAACINGLSPDYSTGILIGLFIYLATFYLLKWTVGKGLAKTRSGSSNHGRGSFLMLFIFSWVLLFTLGVTYLTL